MEAARIPPSAASSTAAAVTFRRRLRARAPLAGSSESPCSAATTSAAEAGRAPESFASSCTIRSDKGSGTAPWTARGDAGVTVARVG
jgi:hypothetical protein